MAREAQREAAQLLFKLSDGNTQAIEKLLPLIYDELRS